jgi:DNA-binding Lrp family transcriptional regulator
LDCLHIVVRAPRGKILSSPVLRRWIVGTIFQSATFSCKKAAYAEQHGGVRGKGDTLKMKTLPDEPALLDPIDRRILAELQDDGRMTNVELARRAGISAPPCLRRVRRLEEAGIVRGYHADTDPQKLGWEITFFAIVGLESQKELVLAGFEKLVADWPEVRECHMIRGGGDFLLRLVARDTAHENQLTGCRRCRRFAPAARWPACRCKFAPPSSRCMSIAS